MKKILRVFVFAIALVLLMSPVVSASIPYATYTYDIYGFVMESPDAYVPSLQVDYRYMGLDAKIDSASLTDIETDDDGNDPLLSCHIGDRIGCFFNTARADRTDARGKQTGGVADRQSRAGIAKVNTQHLADRLLDWF